jgi:hypothetical protein
MSELDASARVFAAVGASLQDAAERELWFAIRSELLRPDGGPEVMKEYMDSEASRIKHIVEQAITRVAGV